MKNSKNGTKKVKKEKMIEGEIIPVPGRKETFEGVKPNKKELGLYISLLYDILDKAKTQFAVVFNTIIPICSEGLIVGTAVIGIIDLFYSYTFGVRTLLHIAGLGAAYHLYDDFFDKLKTLIGMKGAVIPKK